MSSRAESQVSQYGRRRSNTATSILKPPSTASAPAPPLEVGQSKTLNSWVHEPRELDTVILNHVWWPGVSEGDILRVVSAEQVNQDDMELKEESEDNRKKLESKAKAGVLFIVGKHDPDLKHQLQVSSTRPI